MAIDVVWVGAISALAGVTVTGVVNYFINRTNKLYEDRKHRRELILRLAIESRKNSLEEAKLFREAGQSTTIHPVEIHLVKIHKLADLALEENLNSEQLQKVLRESYRLSEDVDRIAREYLREKLKQ